MLKREGMLALFVGVTLFTGDIIEGGVGLGFYRRKANTGNRKQQSTLYRCNAHTSMNDMTS